MPDPRPDDERTIDSSEERRDGTLPLTPPIADGPPPRVPGYELLNEVGRGGMGVVYKAHHLSLNRVVALKMVLAGSHAGPTELTRFRQEAEAIARLQHPNIVQIYEVGQHAGLAYLALEFVEGGTLAQKTAGLPQPPADAARMVEMLAGAVEHAHQNGVIHRDLTPGNVLLTLDGAPKVTDFGLARHICDSRIVTATGAILGTPGYMAPEQAEGSRTAVSPATDVHALGAILYFLLTGRPPFQAASTVETLLHTVGREPARPTQLRPGLPPDLETVCLKCLHKEPARRYGSAGELADDLRRFLADEPIRARPVGKTERLQRWCRRNPAVAALTGLSALLLLVAAVGGVVLSLGLSAALKQAEHDRDAARKAQREGREQLFQSLVAEARARRHSRRIGQRYGTLEALRRAVDLARELDKPPETWAELRNLAIAALSLPDLRPTPQWVEDPADPGWNRGYFSIDDDFRSYAIGDLHGTVSVRHVGTIERGTGSERVRLPSLEGEERVLWSCDGRYLLVLDWFEGHLQTWRLDGDRAVLVLEELKDNRGRDFTQDGRRLLTVRKDGLFRVYDLESRRVERSFSVSRQRTALAVHPRLPWAALCGDEGVSIVDWIAEKEVARLPAARMESPSWSNDGELLALCSGTGVEVWDVARRRRNWSMEHRGGGIEAAFNPEGDLLVSWGWTLRVKLWDPHTGREVFTSTSPWVGGFRREGRLAAFFPDIGDGRRRPLTQVEPAREYRTLVADLGRVKDYNRVELHPDGRLLAVATWQGLSLMDLATGRERAFLPGKVPHLLFEPAGSLLTNSEVGLLRWPILADPAAPHRLRIGPPIPVPVPVWRVAADLARSSDGEVLASANSNGALVWRRERPREVIALKPHDDCRSVAVSPDGELVATGSHSGRSLKVWRARDGQLVQEFLSDVTGTGPSFSADGRWLFNQGGQRWRVGDWTEGTAFPGHRAVFAPAQQRLGAGAHHKGFIPLFDPETGHELARLEDPHQDGLNVVFSPDGTMLIGVTNDSFCVRVWDLRRLRQGLADLGLDWAAPAYPLVETTTPPAESLQLEVIGADKLRP